jgi:hypothetical protein
MGSEKKRYLLCIHYANYLAAYKATTFQHLAARAYGYPDVGIIKMFYFRQGKKNDILYTLSIGLRNGNYRVPLVGELLNGSLCNRLMPIMYSPMFCLLMPLTLPLFELFLFFF